MFPDALESVAAPSMLAIAIHSRPRAAAGGKEGPVWARGDGGKDLFC